jgi:hypothetical protein
MEAIIKKIVNAGGDLTSLSADEKYQYCKLMAEKVGLEKEVAPFKILNLEGRQILYADKGTAEMLRKKHELSFTQPVYEREDNVLSCTLGITDGKRTDYDCGAVSIEGLGSVDYANAKMACMTKAKRRATLSFCGVGMIDESEFDTIQSKIGTAEFSQESGLMITSKKIEKSAAMVDEAKNLNAEKPSKEKTPAPVMDKDPNLWLIAEIDNPQTSVAELWERVCIWVKNYYQNEPLTMFNDNFKRTPKTVKALLKAIHAGEALSFVQSFNPEFAFILNKFEDPMTTIVAEPKETKTAPKTAKKKNVFSEPGTEGRDMIERMKLADVFAGQEQRILDLYPDAYTSIEEFYKFASVAQIELSYE